jgi:hypothetical protein
MENKMIVLKTTVVQVSGYVNDAYLSGITEDNHTHSIRDRQDFELRIAMPLEFKNDLDAIKFLDDRSHGALHYSTGKRIFKAYPDSPRELHFVYEIEEV